MAILIPVALPVRRQALPPAPRQAVAQAHPAQVLVAIAHPFVTGMARTTRFATIKTADGAGKTVKAVSVQIPVPANTATAVYTRNARTVPHRLPAAQVPAVAPLLPAALLPAAPVAHHRRAVQVLAARRLQAPHQVLRQVAAQAEIRVAWDVRQKS